jgi:hypothetical protein
MTLECMICGSRSDPGPRHNPNVIKWICGDCFDTPAAQRLMQEMEEIGQ